MAGELHEKRVFAWTPPRVAAFEKLKYIIVSAPVAVNVEAARSGEGPFRI